MADYSGLRYKVLEGFLALSLLIGSCSTSHLFIQKNVCTIPYCASHLDFWLRAPCIYYFVEFSGTKEAKVRKE